MADSNTQTAHRHQRGGLYFEGFEIGSLTEHRYRRTVTQMDNMLFSNMTLNPQPLHIDRHFCETETDWGQPLMNSLFTLGLMIGIHVDAAKITKPGVPAGRRLSHAKGSDAATVVAAPTVYVPLDILFIAGQG